VRALPLSHPPIHGLPSPSRQPRLLPQCMATLMPSPVAAADSMLRNIHQFLTFSLQNWMDRRIRPSKVSSSGV
jgi:hypothetical protein